MENSKTYEESNYDISYMKFYDEGDDVEYSYSVFESYCDIDYISKLTPQKISKFQKFKNFILIFFSFFYHK